MMSSRNNEKNKFQNSICRGYICTYIQVDSVNSVYIHYEYVQLQIKTIKTHSGLNTSEFDCFTKQKVHGETVQS